MSEREEIVYDPTGKSWGLALMGDEIMVVDFEWPDGGPDYEVFSSENEAEEVFNRIKQEIKTEGWSHSFDNDDNISS